VTELLWKMRVVAKHPRLAYAYVLRKRGIMKLTQQDVQSVRSLYEEISRVPYLQKFAGVSRKLSYAGCAPELYVLTRLKKPAIVVETGVASGVSTTFMLAAMKLNGFGRVESVSLPSGMDRTLPPGKEVGWLVPSELRTHWKLHLGDAKEVLADVLSKLKQIDFFFHDSDHGYEHMLLEFQSAWPIIRAGGYLIADDVWDNSALADFSRKEGVEPFYLGNAGILPKTKPLEATANDSFRLDIS
jgi:cephalosporin hydroxylase